VRVIHSHLQIIKNFQSDRRGKRDEKRRLKTKNIP